jgi:hypothetical protein
MSTDADENGRIDTAYESWIDSNGNHKRDSKEPLVGDFQLMKDMGVNTIRLFRGRQALEYDPSEFNKKLLREMNNREEAKAEAKTPEQIQTLYDMLQKPSDN